MRLNNEPSRTDFDDLVSRFFGSEFPRTSWPTGGYHVTTDVFRTEDSLVIRMELPGVSPDDVDVTVQDNSLVINGSRKFPYEADKARFLHRGMYYGDFAQKVALGKGLDVEKISANFDNGVLELTIPYTEEVQPKKIAIDVGKNKALTG